MNPVRTQREPNQAGRREELWLEEKYWGHRLWDQQSPWLVFLEFLCVAESAHRHGHLFDFEKSQYSSAYYAYARTHLRNILFNNEQQLLRFAAENADSGAAWRKWLEWISENAHGLTPDERDFSYLKDRFDRFHDFAQLVRALRSCAVEGDTNKRWSSRFIFPFGPAAVFEDLSIKQDAIARDYINFGRSGELLYGMVARSSLRERLATVFPERVLATNKWNLLVKQLQPPTAETTAAKRGVDAFLPYDQHPNFELIAEDWLCLLELELPGFDVVPYLVTAGTFGLLLYHLHTSMHLLGRERMPPIICEVVAPRKGLVREQSIECFEANSAMSIEAIEAVMGQVERTPEWNQAGQPQEVLARRRDILQREFSWEDESGTSDPDELWRRFKDEAKRRHRQHFGQIHRTFGRGIGLVSKRGTNRFRYAPTDGFLKCLIFSNVRKRIEFNEFLAQVYGRYGLVFGETEAGQVLNTEDMDKKPFQANSLRLEHRLSSLGLLKRLSDACAYVENPYSR
ncbi:MAG: hypothetical protein ACYDA9_18260 [Terriglobia bacterium]